MSQQINLLNLAFRKKRELFTALMLVQAVAALLVLMLAVYGYQYRQVQALAKQAKDGSAQLEASRARLVKAAAEHAPRPKDADLEKRVTALELQLKGEEAVLEVLQSGSLGNTQGYSGYMRAFARQSMNGLWLTEFSIRGAGREMALGGRTLRPELVTAYIQRLNQEAVMQGHIFAALEIQRPKTEPSTPESPAPVPNYLEFKLHSPRGESDLLRTEAGAEAGR